MPLPYLTVEFKNPKNDKTYHLTYELIEREITRKWLALLNETLHRGIPVWDNGVFYGKIFYEEGEVIESLKTCVRLINEFGAHHIPIIPHMGMSREELNTLHDWFEKLSIMPMYTNLNSNHSVSKAVYDLNTFVHRAEHFLYTGFGGHIEATFHSKEKLPLSNKDYDYFTPDVRFGSLMMTYGIVGVPPHGHFHSKPASPPTPQNVYTPGFTMVFRDDFDFNRWPELRHWLIQTTNIDINKDPIGIGYIPLGRLITKFHNRQEVLNQLKIHNTISKILIDEKKQPKAIKPTTKQQALWPNSGELNRHLDLVPYVDLQIEFDHDGCLQEAFALLDKFVEHRPHNQSSKTGGKWKSLALRAVDGDPTKTLFHTDYNIDSKERYKNTSISQRCPKTMVFLEKWFDVGRCERIRFMLLEPGAKIAPHSDASDRRVCTAFNIALNNPKNCNFFIETDKKGTHHQFTRRIPFFPGTFMLINNAKNHYVENLSDTPRIHIIVHGPVKIQEEAIIKKARRQNLLENERAVIEKLIDKAIKLGETSPEYLQDLNSSRVIRHIGVAHKPFTENVKILVLDEKFEDKPDLQYENLHNITKASLYPVEHEVILAENLDAWLDENRNYFYQYIVIMMSGTYIKITADFIFELRRTFKIIEDSQALLMGHIMDMKGDSKSIPYLHEQFAILNYQEWKNLKAPGFGPLYSKETFTFPPYMRSAENIHDHYTPLWLKPAEAGESREGRKGWGAELIAYSLSKNRQVLNLPIPLRNTKMFTYPKTGRDKQYYSVKTEIDKTLEKNMKRIFKFNNEPLRIMSFPNFQPDTLISVAAGFKPFSILKQFYNTKPLKRIIFTDHGEDATKYYKNLLEQNDYSNLVDYLVTIRNISEKNISKDRLFRETSEELEKLIASNFDNDKNSLLELIKMAKNIAVFHTIDFIKSPDKIVQLLRPDEKTIFWHSNSWDCNSILFSHSKDELKESYCRFSHTLKVFYGKPTWVNTDSFDIIIGDSFDDITAFMTSGIEKKVKYEESYYQRI